MNYGIISKSDKNKNNSLNGSDKFMNDQAYTPKVYLLVS